MTNDWTPCYFFPRGTKTVEWTYEPVDNANWGLDQEADLADFFTSTNLSTRRLEGDFMVGGKTEAVTLYIAEKGVTGDKPLLIVNLRDDTPLVALLQSGSGTGDPK